MATWKQVECNDRIDKRSCQNSIISFKNDLDDKQYSTLKLNLPEYPRQGDFVRASKIFDVIPDEKYVFSTYVMSPYYRKDGKSGFFDVNIYINNIQKRKLHIADSNKYKYIKIENIQSHNGKIKITFEIESHIDHSVASWQKASLVNFKFTSLRKEGD